MTSLVRVHRKGQMTLPSRLRLAIGISEGDIVEASIERGKIVLAPQLVIDRSKFPSADDEYTPAQRRAVDRGIAASQKEYKRGRALGPFETAEQLLASLHKQGGKAKTKNGKRKAA
jgi:AbrB family looped-hinge helix DNA binding protein